LMKGKKDKAEGASLEEAINAEDAGREKGNCLYSGGLSGGFIGPGGSTECPRAGPQHVR